MKMLNGVGRVNSSRFPRNVPSKSVRNSAIKKEICELKQQQENGSDSSLSSNFFQGIHRSKARLRAEEEDEKLMREQKERAEKLQKFQVDVQKRVSAMKKIKQQKEIEQGVKDMNIACNVMRSCVGFTTSIIDPQKFLVPLNQSDHSSDEVPHNNSLSSQNQEIQTVRSHNSITNEQPLLEERISWNSNTSANGSLYGGPVRIICNDKQAPNTNCLITGGMKGKTKLNKVLDNTCSGHSKNHVVSMVQSDETELQEMKKHQTLQRTLSRKVFMDLEREKTREVERLSRQRMEMFLLRNTREAVRREVETSAREVAAPSGTNPYQKDEYPDCIQTSEEVFPKHSLHKVSYARKLLSLVQLLEERCTKLCIPVPSLCPCGTSATDPLRNNCANNCQFYKNPAEYCRAIKCLISSMESNKQPRPFLT